MGSTGGGVGGEGGGVASRTGVSQEPMSRFTIGGGGIPFPFFFTSNEVVLT